MKQLAVNEIFGYMVEHYDLNDIVPNIVRCPGLFICYLIATCNGCELIRMDLEATYVGPDVPVAWKKAFGKEFPRIFKAAEYFLNMYDAEDFGTWNMTIFYNDARIDISGERLSPVIGVSYSKKKTPNIMYLFNSVSVVS